MNPDDQKPTFDEIPPEPHQTNVSPWRSSQSEPVVHTVTTPQPSLVQPATPKRTFGQKIKALLKSWKFWLTIFALLVATLIALWFIQPTRWWLANLVGARNILTITTISPGEGKAKLSELRNVAVTVNGVVYHTDSKGQLQVRNIPYGAVTISSKKNGFADVNYGVTLDFDPFFHKLGGKATDDAARNITLSMRGVGIPISFKVINWLSGKPVTTGDFAISDVVGKPDDQGLVSLKVPGTDAQKVTVNATFGGAYVDKVFDVSLGASAVPEVKVVPGGRNYFLGRQTGVLTLYSSNLDGSDVQPIVTGTGHEAGATNFAVSPDGKYGVLSSSRDGAYNQHHDLLQRVYVVDLGSKQITRVDEGVNVNFADWSGDELIYTTTSYDNSSNSFPTTLRGVDVGAQRVYNFETADYISVATVAAGKVVYQHYANSGPDQTSSPILREAPVNATTSQTLGDQVDYDSYWQIAFDHINFKTDQDQAWHEYNLSTDQIKTISQPSTGNNTTQYLSIANSDGTKYLMIDRIGGQYTLFVKNSDGTQTMVYGGNGLSGPFRWINDSTITYRVVSDDQSADYVFSLDGNKTQKIIDVTQSNPSNPPGAPASQRFSYY